jgi:hypothetical protein
MLHGDDFDFGTSAVRAVHRLVHGCYSVRPTLRRRSSAPNVTQRRRTAPGAETASRCSVAGRERGWNGLQQRIPLSFPARGSAHPRLLHAFGFCQNPAMGQHFLPRYYLRGFERDGGLWAYDRFQTKSFATQLKAVANENRMWSDEIESYLANEIEDTTKQALDVVRKRKHLSPNDRWSLARYIVVMWKRVPKARERALQKLPALAEEVRAKRNAELDVIAANSPDLADQVQHQRQSIDRAIAKYMGTAAAEVWYRSLQSPTTQNVIDALLSMNWLFLFHDELQFLTCDNPVFFFEHEGIGAATADLTVPLSSSVTLWATRAAIPLGEFARASDRAVKGDQPEDSV